MDSPPASSSDDDDVPLAVFLHEDPSEGPQTASATAAEPLAPVPVTIITGGSDLRPSFFGTDVFELPAAAAVEGLAHNIGIPLLQASWGLGSQRWYAPF